MGILYVISHSPFKRRDSVFHVRMAQKGDAIIFIQNGVVAAKACPPEYKKDCEEAEARGVKLYFLKEDLIARGIDFEGKETVDYDGFLDLIEKMDRVAH